MSPAEKSAPQTAPHPTLSVIIPIYNVELYLDECLHSVAEQSLTDLEVIMVDDGSEDSSADIAAEWERKDPRFRLHRQENRGPGHARNQGIDRARGTFLTFMDSDDIILPDAYLTLVESLRRSGSDCAVGNVERFDSERSWGLPMYRSLLAEDRSAQHITRVPELLHDSLVPNKVWRSSFWRRHDLRFPEGVFYEDIPVMLAAHFHAEQVDLLAETVFHWRLRDSGDSITQTIAADQRKFTDRLIGINANLKLFADNGAEDLEAEYRRLVLRRDFRYYIDVFDQLDEEYRSVLRESVQTFLGAHPHAALADVPYFDRLKYAFLLAGEPAALIDYLQLWRSRQLGDVPAVIKEGRVELDLASRLGPDLGLDPELLDFTDQLDLVSEVSALRITDEEVVIEGSAYVGRISGVHRSSERIEVWLENGDSRIRARLERREDPAVATRAGVGIEGAEHTGFTARFPLEKFRRKNGYSTRSWKAMVSATCQGHTVSGPLCPARPGAAQRPRMRPLGGGWWVRMSWIDKQSLTVRIREELAVLSKAKITDDFTDLHFDLASGFSGQLWLTRKGSETVVTAPIKRRSLLRATGVARIRTAELRRAAESPDSDEEQVWQVRARRASDGCKLQINVADDFRVRRNVTGDRELHARRTRSGVLRLHDRRTEPLLLSASWGDRASLNVVIDCPDRKSIASVVVRSNVRDESHEFPVNGSSRRIRATLDLGAISDSINTRPLRSGVWLLKLRMNDGHELPVAIAGGPGSGLPVSKEHAGREYSVTDRHLHQSAIKIESELPHNELGKANQHRLQTLTYPRAKTRLREAVLYETYLGRQFTDSPRQIFEELIARGADLEHLVVSHDQQAPIPEGATRLVQGSVEYYEAMAQCRYIIASTFRPTWFERAEGQVVVQTWHGTPLKRIGLDIDLAKYSDPGYHLRIPAMSAQWDYLLSASEYTTPIMRSAFAYKGTLLETGLPRNDKFFGTASSEITRRVREHLGIREHQRIVLYAPTWRDNRGGPKQRFRLQVDLDLKEMADVLGDEYAVVFRKHPMLPDQLPAETQKAIVDASDYPDIQDLLVATDILVTDYSSVMFDFANTGRPMLFYTYDLEHFRDDSLGLYFDFEAEAPGPLLRTADDLLRSLKSIDQVSVEYREQYEKFKARFCTWDDGGAAGRVVDAVFGASGSRKAV